MIEKEEKLFKRIEESIKAFFEAGFDEDASVKDWLDWVGKDEFPITVPSEEPNCPILRDSREDPFSGEFVKSLDNLLKKTFNCIDLEVITPIPRWVEELLNELDGTSGWEWQYFYIPESEDLYIETSDHDDYYDEVKVIQSYVEKVLQKYDDPEAFIRQYKDRMDPDDYEDIFYYDNIPDILFDFFETIIHY